MLSVCVVIMLLHYYRCGIVFLTETVDREDLCFETSVGINYSKCYGDWLQKHDG